MALLLGLALRDPALVEAFLKAREAEGVDYTAAREAVTRRGAAALPFLRERLGDRSWEARLTAAAMILRIEDARRARAFDTRFADLSDPSLAPTGLPPRFERADGPLLVEMWIKARSRPVKVAGRAQRVESREPLVAQEELEALGDLELVTPLLGWLEGERGEAAVRLVAACGEAAVPKLKELLRAGPTPTRRVALEALALRPVAEVREDLLAAARDEEPYLRSAAAGALGRAKPPEARTVLEKMLATDPSKFVRVAAADGLRTLGPAGSVEALLAALENESLKVSAAAARALAEVGTDAVRSPLRRHLQDYRQEEAAPLRAWCLRGLGAAGWDGDADLIAEFLEDQADEVRAAAVRALVQVDPKRGAAEAVDALKADRSALVRREAVRALGSRPETQGAVLEALREDDSSSVRAQAAAAAAAFGTAEARAALKQASEKDADPEVRERAAALLKEAKP